MVALQVIADLRNHVGWQQGLLTAAYCTLTLATAKALAGTLSAAPADLLQETDCTMLATEALLLLLSLSACLHNNTQSTNQSSSDSSSSLHCDLQLPPGHNNALSQQLQSSIDAVCITGSMLLQSCAPLLKGHLCSALMLAILPAVQAIPSGVIL